MMTQAQIDSIPVAVTLTVSDWNRITAWLGDRPFKEVNAIIQSISQQGHAGVQAMLAPEDGAPSQLNDPVVDSDSKN